MSKLQFKLLLSKSRLSKLLLSKLQFNNYLNYYYLNYNYQTKMIIDKFLQYQHQHHSYLNINKILSKYSKLKYFSTDMMFQQNTFAIKISSTNSKTRILNICFQLKFANEILNPRRRISKMLNGFKMQQG